MTGKITRSLISPSGLKITSTSSPSAPAIRFLTRGIVARLAVGSTDTLPSAATYPERNVREETLPFPHCVKNQDEATPAFRGAGLIRVGDDARIEQCRRLEGIFMQKVCSDQLTLGLGENRVGRKGDFHFVGARFEGRQKVAVATLKIFQHIGQLVGCDLGIERHDPLDDMVRAGIVGGIEVARFGRRLERAHDHPRRIGTQVEPAGSGR